MSAGAPAGNTNARRGREFRDSLRRALKANGADRLRTIAENLVAAAEQGEQWAIKEIADRIDGKPQQAIDHRGAVGTFDLSNLSDDELGQLESILSRVAESV